MNHAAQFTLRILGAVLVLFALAILLYPIFKLTTPPIIEKSMDALIVAFVAMLARTGSDVQTNVEHADRVGPNATVNTEQK
jgi:hypothetical protein